MSESAALETAENGAFGHTHVSVSAAERLELEFDGLVLVSHDTVTDASSLSVNSTSPGTAHSPPVVQISLPPEQENSGEDACGESADNTSTDSLSDEVDGLTKDAGQIDVEGQRSEGDNAEWKPPDDALMTKIINQVEFYFSDANITKDAFLLKHVRRNKEGFVSLKLITSFKKVKSLTKDWRTVCHSLGNSITLEINAEGTKVKRRDPLPDYDETTPSRTVVALNLPFASPSIENIAELFKQCGEISLVRILRPGKPLPNDVRKHMEKHGEIRNRLCALVEFESGQSALKAAKTMCDKDNWRTGLVVTVLDKEKRKEKKEKSSNSKMSPSQGGDQTASDGGEGGDSAKKKKRQRKRKNIRVDELSANTLEQPATPSSSDTDNSPLPNRRSASRPIGIPQGSKSPSHLSPGTTPKGSPIPSPHGSPHGSPRQQRKVKGRSPLASSRNSPRNSPRGSPELGRKAYDSFSDHSNTSSPWVQRRKLLAANRPEGSPIGSPLMGRRSLTHGNEIDSLLRLPTGPDGTKGFMGGRGRGKPRVGSI